MAIIARIMGRIQKMGKDENWLFQQIQRRNPNIHIDLGMTMFEILDVCTDSLLTEVEVFLGGVDITDLELPRYSETYHWFFTDLVASSDPDVTVDDQARKILELNKLIQKTNTFRNRDQASTIILPTGDGNAIGFKDNPEKPVVLAIELHKAINHYNASQPAKRRIDVRIGLSSGPVYKIKDLLGNPNVWGPGIIYARRVMDLGRAKSILANDSLAENVRKLKPEFKKLIQLIGDYPIKHEVIPIYNVYGVIDGIPIGTKRNPIARRVEKSQIDSALSETAKRFYYISIDAILEVSDEKTQMTHHVNIWRLINIQDKAVDRYFCYVEGDVPRGFPDLNVRITDENGKELAIKSLNVNKPYRKEFFIQFDKPLNPQEKGRLVKLEWDWEEPERYYDFRFASDCKKFRYLLTVPKDMSIEQKVATKSPETGDLEYAATPAKVTYLKDKTQVEWIGHDIEAFDGYRFLW